MRPGLRQVLLGGGAQWGIPPQLPWVAAMRNSFDIYQLGFVPRPTLFYDPTATSSGNAGTFRNPYNSLATVVARCAGDMSGQVLGVKRGTKTLGSLDLHCYGTPGAPFVIAPYGDAAAQPTFSGETVRTGWTAYSGDTRIWQHTGIATAVDVYENDVRLISVSGANLAAKITAIQTYISAPNAGTVGVFAYDGTTLYAYFVDLADPTIGQVKTADISYAVHVIYPDVAGTGNVSFIGMAGIYARNDAFSIEASSSSYANAPSNLKVIGCYASKTGAQRASGIGQDGFSVYGSSSSAPATGVYIAGNYSSDCLNNAYEVAFSDGALIEHNLSDKISGNSIIEFWACNKNGVARFNRGYGDPLYSLYGNTGRGSGVWATNYDTGAGSTKDSTKNGGHKVYFNHIQDSRNELIDNESPNNQYFNNALVSLNVNPANCQALFTGNDATLTGNIFKNNLCLHNVSGSSPVFVQMSGASTPVPTMDNNAYFDIITPSAGRLINNGTTYTTLAAWTAAISQDAHSLGTWNSVSVAGLGAATLAQCGVAFTSSYMGANTDYTLTASVAQGAGASIASSGVTTDLNGAAIPNVAAPNIGCKAA